MRAKVRLRHLKLGFFLTLVALVVGLGGSSFARKVDSFQPAGFSARPAGGGLHVERVERPETGVAAGDRLLMVNGAQVTGVEELRRELRRRPESQVVLLRDERLLSINYHRPPVDLDAPYLILSLIAAIYLLIGMYTALRDSRRQATLFLFWCLASAAVYLLSPTSLADATGRAIFVVEEVARVLLPPLTLHLFLVFPTAAGLPPWARRLPHFFYLPAVVFLTLQADAAFNGGALFFGGRPSAAALGALDRMELAHLAIFALLALGLLVRRLALDRDWEEHRQMQWIAIGLAGGYVPFLVLYLLPHAAGARTPELLTAGAVLPLAFVPLAFAYAILRYKLWDIGVIVRDVAAYTVTLLLGVLSFSLANLAITRGVPAHLGLARNLLAFVAGLLIASLMAPAKRGIAHALERVQYRSSFGKRRALAQAGRELLHERDLDRLCAALLRQLEEGLELERANLFLAQGEALLPVRPEPGLPIQLARDVFGADFWEREALGISGVALPEASPAPGQRLFMLGYRYAFPLTVRGTRVGMVITGYRAEATPLNSDDVDLVRSLLNQAVLAIENAQLVDQLHRQLEEVVRLQQHNEGIIESSPAGIAVLDREGRVASANLAFAALAGVERRQAIGRPLAELLPVAPLPAPGEGLVEVSFCDPQGEERHLQVSSALLDRRGEEQRVLVVLDVSERVAMAAALREKDRLAELGMLAAGVAHEVNTPITGISSYAQMLLQETPQSDPRYEVLRKMEKQTFRAARIVNNLLELSRSRKQEAHPVEVAALLGECAELLRERLARRGVRLAFAPPAEDLLVVGNDGELHQVFTNLMLNAVDAMGDGGVLTLEVEGDDERVRATVTDTGPGISPSMRDKIFQPFFTTKLGEGGTGLGLSISANLVERHGGSLRAADGPSGGARFVVDLPRHRGAA